MAKKRRLQKLTVSLIKDGVDAGEALRERDDLVRYDVPPLAVHQGQLVAAPRPPLEPGWLKYLSPHLDRNPVGIFTASASALLLFEVAGRLFAVTFGQGRHLLLPDAIEPDFGLKVVLNTVAPDQLKSVDAKTVDDTTVHTRRDLSRSSSLSAFGLDVTRDLLRAVTGTPQDPSLAHQLTGADALGIHTRDQVPDLPALAERLLEAYGSDEYKKNFDFIDYLRPEKDPAQILRLEECLVEVLNSGDPGDLTDVHVAAPQPLEWIDLAGFRFSTESRDSEEATDPRVTTYLASRQDQAIDVDLLKRDRLIAIRAADLAPLDDWSVYKSLVYQAELDDHLFVLSAGRWYRVDLDYRARVEKEAFAIPEFTSLPNAIPGASEGDYNKSAAKAIDGLCLDGMLVQDGGPDRMEVCDILLPSGFLIHVKHRGSSSTLSHLFMQGLNSAERLRMDAHFRSEARKIVAQADPSFSTVIGDPVDPAKHTIVFGVITRSTRSTPMTLPFFSVVSLRAAAQRLQGLGYQVAQATIRQT